MRTFMSLTQALSTLRRVLLALSMPSRMAASKPSEEAALISVTLATATVAVPPFEPACLPLSFILSLPALKGKPNMKRTEFFTRRVSPTDFGECRLQEAKRTHPPLRHVNEHHRAPEPAARFSA